MLAAELRKVPYSKGSFVLVIKNYGPTIARDVEVRFDPQVPDPSDAAQSVTHFLKRRYAKPIPTLVPGMELSNIWFSGVQEGGGWRNTEPTPDRCTITIRCTAADGTAYEDDFVIDVALLRAETYIESSTAPEARTKVIADSLKSVDRSLTFIARTMSAAQIDRPSGVKPASGG